jgi:hypothetical protein
VSDGILRNACSSWRIKLSAISKISQAQNGFAGSQLHKLGVGQSSHRWDNGRNRCDDARKLFGDRSPYQNELPPIPRPKEVLCAYVAAVNHDFRFEVKPGHATNWRMDKTIRKYTDFEEMKMTNIGTGKAARCMSVSPRFPNLLKNSTQ